VAASRLIAIIRVPPIHCQAKNGRNREKWGLPTLSQGAGFAPPWTERAVPTFRPTFQFRLPNRDKLTSKERNSCP